MRRTLGLSGLALALTGFLSAPAFAKGVPTNAVVSISGPGIHFAITIEGEDGGSWLDSTGGYGAKWEVPNVAGTLAPHAQLGPAYDAITSIDCSEGTRSIVHQVLYPYAPGGPQILMPPGQTACDAELPAGYVPAPAGFLDTLLGHGFPAHAPAMDAAASSANPDRDGNPLGVIAGLVAVAVAATLALLGVAAQLRGRRRSAAA